MWRDLFSPPHKGPCLCCHETIAVIGPADGEQGFCDVCSHALRHAWQRAQGERIAALSPHLVRSYVLIPRLPKGRVETDLSAYEFAVDLDGNLPYFEWTKKSGPRSVPAWLESTFGLTTWQETLRACYLGYSGSADFSEVLLAWAWGKSPSLRRSAPERHKFASFATLLGVPTPDAGFYLGIKVAFEALLWRLEMQPEANKLCVAMRELAMNYLRAKKLLPGVQDEADAGDDEDLASMVDAFRASMTTDELTVAAFLTKSAEEAREARERSLRPKPEPYSPEISTLDADGEEQAEDDGAEIPEGFARSPRG